jgi:hypothetical protein
MELLELWCATVLQHKRPWWTLLRHIRNLAQKWLRYLMPVLRSNVDSLLEPLGRLPPMCRSNVSMQQ